MLLAKMLAQRNADGDRTSADQILESLTTEIGDADYWIRLDAVETLCKIRVAADDSAGASRAITEIATHLVSPAAIGALQARLKIHQGNRESAANFVRDALAKLQQDSPREDKLLVSAVLEGAGLDAEAFQLLRPLLPTDQIVGETRRLLDIALRLGEDRFVLDFCISLRMKGIWDARLIGAEAEIYVKYNALNDAIDTLKQYLSTNPPSHEAKRARARLSMIAESQGRSDLIEADVSRLPSVSEAGPMWGEVTAQVISFTDRTRALDYAYKLVRLQFNRPEAHRAIIRLIAGGELAVTIPEVAGPGVAVKYHDVVLKDDRWVVIEDGASPDSARGELAPSHPMAKALNGKRVGESFIIDENRIQDRVGIVRELRDKRLYRMHDCADQFRHRFPGEPFFIIMFTADAAKPDEFVKMMRRSVDEKIEHVEHAEKVYAEGPAPIAMFAEAVGGSVVDAVVHLTSHSKLRIFSSLGTGEEADATAAILAKAESIVLDPTALAVLMLSGTYTELKGGKIRMIASEGTLSEIRRQYLLEDRSSPSGWVGRDHGGFRFTKPDAEAHARRRSTLKKFLEWVEANITIESGLPVIDMPPHERDPLVDALGRPTYESIMLARAPGRILWTEDLTIGRLAWGSFKVSSVPSQAAADLLAHHAQATSDAVNELAIWLLRGRVHFTRVWPATITYAASKVGWNLNDDSLKLVLSVLGSNEYEVGGRAWLAAHSLRRVWEEAPLPSVASQLTYLMLDNLRRGNSGAAIIDALCNHIWIVFRKNNADAVKALFTIYQWRGRYNKV